MQHRKFTRSLVVGIALALTSCGFDLQHRAVTPFVLACDGEGDTYDPETGSDVDTGDRIDSILAAVECEFAARESKQGDVGKRRRILIHIHGGLNSRSASLKNAYRSQLRMRSEPKDSADYCVPIFVTWESALLPSYVEHLTKLRNGRHLPWLAGISSPIWLATDIASGIVNTPRTLTTRLSSDVALGIKVPTDYDLLPSWGYAKQSYEALRKRNDPENPRYLLGEYSRGALVQGLRFVWYLVTLLPSVAVTAVAIDGPGTGAWGAMRHRAAILHQKYHEFEHDGSRADAGAEKDDTTNELKGPVARLFHRLREHIAAQKTEHPNTEYEVVLVGHSMGTIVLNDALHQLLHREAEFPKERALPVSHIVYMAAACSIQDADRAVVPYVDKHRDTTRFHALTLHPMAEVDEQNFLDFAPRGSLLEWVDNWYSNPATPAERRFGKWVNLLQAIQVFHPIEKQMTVKGFGVSGSDLPQKHGQFNNCPFWRADFWKPGGRMSYPDRWDDIESADPARRF